MAGKGVSGIKSWIFEEIVVLLRAQGKKHTRLKEQEYQAEKQANQTEGAELSDRKNRHNEKVTLDDGGRDDGYCGGEGSGESGRTRILLRQHNEEGAGRSEERRERA